MKVMRSPPVSLAASPPRSRSLARRTGTGPIPVWIVRSGPWPCRTTRARSLASPFVLHRSQERIRFRLNRLGQKPACAIAQNRRQGIVEVVWMLKSKNGAIGLHGVSPLREVLAGFVTRLDTSPSSNRHHPASAIAPDRFGDAVAESGQPVWAVGETYTA